MSGGITGDLKERGPGLVEYDHPDAKLIELGMLKMQVEKLMLYKLFCYLYLGADRGLPAAANTFKKSEWWVRKRHREGLGFLMRHCANR